MSTINDDRLTTPESARVQNTIDLAQKQQRHPAVSALLSYFTYEHLPEHLAAVSKPFCVLANDLADALPGNAETTVALRKLLEAKDCAVRSAVS